MKVKIVGKEILVKKDTQQKWTSFQCVTDVKCSVKGGPTYGGVKVHQFMIDYDTSHDALQIGSTYECVVEEQFYKGAIQSRIVGLV